MPRGKTPKKIPESTMKDRASRATIIDVAKRAGITNAIVTISSDRHWTLFAARNTK